MHIAISSYCRYREVGGITTWLRDLSIGLSKRGHLISVYLEDILRDNQSIMDDPNSIIYELRKENISVTVTTRRTDKNDTTNIESYLNTILPDIFLPSFFPHHFEAAAKLGRSKGLAWGIVLHDHSKIYHQLLDSVIDGTRHGLPFVVCPSLYTEKVINRIYPQLITHQISHGVDIPNQSAYFSDRPFLILYVGRLAKRYKNVKLTISSMILACKISPQVKAAVIGIGPLEGWAKEEVKSSGLTSQIEFKGQMNHDECQRELLRAQALLLLSSAEMCPYVLFEAMAAGVVPIISGEMEGGIPRLLRVSSAGLLVNARAPSVADKIVNLSQSSTQWTSCSNNARKFASLYSKEKFITLWEDTLETYAM